MNYSLEETGFLPADILLPKNQDLYRWSVVACDQYTSEPDYWDKVKDIVGDAPSTYHMVFPEIYLEKEGFDQRIEAINHTMKDYLERDIFQEYPGCFLLVRRRQADGKIRNGLIGMVDLEQYDFSRGSQTLVRATEGTVLERIPPRVNIRKHALLELPHIMLLIDDPGQTVIEPLVKRAERYTQVYSTDLMLNGGHVDGYLVDQSDYQTIASSLHRLADPEEFQRRYHRKDKGVLLFAMGDGNHSLATAKECYQQLKEEIGEEAARRSPARYALAELVNLHDDALEFEAIHRVVFGIDPQMLLIRLVEQFDISVDSDGPGQSFLCLYQGKQHKITIKDPSSNLTVGTLQSFLDSYVAKYGGKIDYIHGTEVVKKLSDRKDCIGFILPDMKKEELFPTVVLDSALPRKTFSMGNAWDKRYYLECRKIKIEA